MARTVAIGNNALSQPWEVGNPQPCARTR